MNNSPLNPLLFQRLQEEFGRVQVSHAGCAAIIKHEPSIFDGKVRANFVAAGEYYRVSCPYCNDQRGRLWINHRFGVPDEITNSKNLWSAICFNENCLSTVGRPLELYERIYGFKNANLRGQEIKILPGMVEESVLSPVIPPGLLLRVDRLPNADYVRNYLLSRSVDPDMLGKTYDVSYCLDADANYPLAQGRIVIPIIMRGILVGWQCRYVGDPDFKTTGIIKYYSRPGMPRRLMLYNFDNAIKFPYVVVCEGPADVWNVGPQAVAAFGKHISSNQLQLLCENWDNGLIIILLDGDAWEDSQVLEQRLIQQRYNGTIVPICLPQDKDPADLDSKFLWEYIRAEVLKRGIDLSTFRRDVRDFKTVDAGLRYPGHRAINDTRREVGSLGPIPDYSANSAKDAATRS